MPDDSTPIFKGFSAGKHDTVALPVQCFRDVFPYISDAGAMQVILFCFRALHQQAHTRATRFHYLIFTDFTGDEALTQALERIAPDTALDEHLTRILANLITFGFLLQADITQADVDTPQTLYFVNTPKGREAIAQIEQGNIQQLGEHIAILPERPNIYKLYEENIGSLTPLIADALQDAEDDYPHEWIIDAIRLAVENNARNWRYISAILKRWQEEGRNANAPHERHRQWSDQRQQSNDDEYADFIES